MCAASLKEIEQSLKVLWTNRQMRDEFLSGATPDGVHSEIVDQIDTGGIKLYANMIRIGQNDLMDSIYPICAHLIGKGFHDIVAKYFEQFPPVHFNLNKGAEHFSEFLKEHGDRYVRKYPFLPELADYEWLELEVMESFQKVETYKEIDLNSPELFDKFAPVVNPTLTIRKYNYPVSRVVDWVKDGVKLPRRVKKGNEILAVYRMPVTDEIKFLELGSNACKIIETAIESKTSYSELIKLVIEGSKNLDPQSAVMDFLQLIDKYQDLKVFVGSREID